MPEIEHTLTVGIVLLTVVPLVAIDAVSTLRAGFNNAFWEKPLEEKLHLIAARHAAWRRLGIVWIFVLGAVASGLTAFTFQMAAAGEGVWAALGLGAFLTGAASFLAGAMPMITTVAAGALERQRTGSAPPWMQPAWDAGGWLERGFIITANLGYVAIGVAILRSGFPADWAGWVAVISGTVLAAWAALREDWFQHMTLVTPLVVGVALLLY